MKSKIQEFKSLVLVITLLIGAVVVNGTSYAQEEDESTYEETKSVTTDETPEETSVEDSTFSEE